MRRASYLVALVLGLGLARAASAQPINVTDGKPVAYPTHYNGSVRLRALPASFAGKCNVPPQREGEVLVILEVTAEPRLQGFFVKGEPRIDKALDDQGQALFPNPDGPLDPSQQSRGGTRYVPLRFKSEKAASTAIKELTGAITTQVLGERTELASLADPLKAAGKSFKVPNGGAVELVAIEKRGTDYQIKVRIEGEQVGGFVGGNINIQGGGMVIINGQRIGGPMSADDDKLPKLVDAKGQPYRLTAMPQTSVRIANGVASRELTMVFQPNAGQEEPARLAVIAHQQITLQVPFVFTNVPVGK